MIPLAFSKKDLEILKKMVVRVAGEVERDKDAKLDFLVGTMIELPRAALKAGELAETAAFFSFGTNDLTQTAFGISRDDAASFLPAYQDQGILEHDPFVTLDQAGVGALVRIGVERGKAARPDLKVGIRSEEHTSELQSLMRISYAVVWLKNKKIYRI